MLILQVMLVVYVLSLAPLVAFDWQRFALLSLYVQLIGLAGLVIICWSRDWLNRLSINRAVLLTLLLMAAITLGVNAFFQWLYARDLVEAAGYDLQWALRDSLIVLVLVALALRYGFLQQRWLMEQRATESARYDALQSRIQPHFLFNTMNSIASLIQVAPEKAESAVEDLSHLLRQQIDTQQRFYRWQQELALCEAYLRIESLRYGERLAVTWSIDAVPNDLQVPPLILQPLLENAIRHGIAPMKDKGFIRVFGTIIAGKPGKIVEVKLVIENSVQTDFLPYADAGQDSQAEDLRDSVRDRAGIALVNVRSRVASLYRDPDTGDERASVDFELLSGICRVTLRLPYGQR